MIVTGKKIIQEFEQFSPPSLAVEGDKIGLQIGTLDKPVSKVLVTLDVSRKVVEEAISIGAELIIAHHPPIFRPLKTIPHNSVFTLCIQHEIAVYVAHTNLDVTVGGVNDWFSERLGLQNTSILAETGYSPLVKVAVYVPETHEREVRAALGDNGAGAIGSYSYCSFTSKGLGRFLPGEDTHPHIGQHGKLETVNEVKIETIVPEEKLPSVLCAMKNAHPYEEVAYDLYSLKQKGAGYGLGRIGELTHSMTLVGFAQFAKERFGVQGVRYVGNGEALVRRVAVLGGDGNKYIQAAKQKGADVLVTGDMYFHVAQDAEALGLSIVDVGHYAEYVMKEGVVKEMQKRFNYEKVSWVVSSINTDPFTFVV